MDGVSDPTKDRKGLFDVKVTRAFELTGGFAKREGLCLSGDCFTAAADPATLARPTERPAMNTAAVLLANGNVHIKTTRHGLMAYMNSMRSRTGRALHTFAQWRLTPSFANAMNPSVITSISPAAIAQRRNPNPFGSGSNGLFLYQIPSGQVAVRWREYRRACVGPRQSGHY
jgi:hypothetical protein